jgi:hypothetical protein
VVLIRRICPRFGQDIDRDAVAQLLAFYFGEANYRRDKFLLVWPAVLGERGPVRRETMPLDRSEQGQRIRAAERAAHVQQAQVLGYFRNRAG